MNRQSIPLNQLMMRSFATWSEKWFLLTAGENRPGAFNSMTVSWGGLGVIWGRPLAVIFVRPQRYTREFTDQHDTFSLCVFPETCKPALNMLGTLSGRNTDKMQECGLTPIALSEIACPGYDEAELILECKKSYFNDLDPKNFLADYIAENYQKDYHRMYFGEVLAVSGTAEYVWNR